MSNQEQDSNLHRDNLLVRAWRGDLAWYKAFLVMLVVLTVVTALTGWVDKANAQTARPEAHAAHAVVRTPASSAPIHPNICQPNPPPELVCSPAQFNKYFDVGAYGRTIAIQYSNAFKKFFLFSAKQHADANPGFVPCPGSPDLGCTWDQYTHHDSCAVSSLPDTFDADSCRASKGLKGLLDSPYWTQRGETQTKWEGRIVWCGTVAVVALFFRASPGAAVGSGSGVCLGGRLVP